MLQFTAYLKPWESLFHKTFNAFLGPTNYNVIAHLEIETINPPRACLPITDTGYLSHFHPMGTIEREYDGDVVMCVRDWLNARAKDPTWKRYVEASRQGDLFT